jgi:hypothetical protein
MVKKILAGVLATICASNSMAAVTISTIPFQVLPINAAKLIDFEGQNVLPSGFTSSQNGSVTLQNGSHSGVAAEPMNDPTQYLAISGGSYTLQGTTGFDKMSFYWGSIDGGNRIDLLDANGATFYTLFGNSPLLTWSSDGNWFGDWSNRTVSFASDQKIYGAKFSYEGTAFELDNVAFGSVPEPATWGMMIVGFGLIGAALRTSRKSTARGVIA